MHYEARQCKKDPFIQTVNIMLDFFLCHQMFRVILKVWKHFFPESKFYPGENFSAVSKQYLWLIWMRVRLTNVGCWHIAVNMLLTMGWESSSRVFNFLIMRIMSYVWLFLLKSLFVIRWWLEKMRANQPPNTIQSFA